MSFIICCAMFFIVYFSRTLLRQFVSIKSPSRRHCQRFIQIIFSQKAREMSKRVDKKQSGEVQQQFKIQEAKTKQKEKLFAQTRKNMDDFSSSNFASSFKWRLSTIVLWVETLVVNLLFHSFISGWLWSVKRTEIWDISSEVSVCWICLFYFISLRSLCCSFLFSSTSSPRYTAHTFSSYWSFHFLCSLHFFGLRIILHKCAFLLLLFIVSFICCLVGLHRTAGQDSATEYVNVYVALKITKGNVLVKKSQTDFSLYENLHP